MLFFHSLCLGLLAPLVGSERLLEPQDGLSRPKRWKEESRRQQLKADEWIQQQHSRSSVTTSPFLLDCPCETADLCQPISSPTVPALRATGELYGFVNEGDAPTNRSSFFNWTHVSTIAWASLDATMCEAHRHGVRAIVAAPSFDLTRLVHAPSEEITAWVNQTLRMVQERHRDGVVFDYELPLKRTSPEAQAYLRLIQATTAAFHSATLPADGGRPTVLQVVVCVAWSPDAVDGRDYPYKELSDASDALYVMDYDTASEIFDECTARANAPFPGMVRGIERYLELGIAPSKLILGVPWYGYRYECLTDHPQDRFCPIPFHPWREVNCSDAAGDEVPFVSILARLRASQKDWSLTGGGIRRDDYMDAPFFNAIETSLDPNATKASVVVQYWFDDETSLRHKFAWARRMGLAGVGPYSFDHVNPIHDPMFDLQSRLNVSHIWEAFDAYFQHAEDTTNDHESMQTTS